ncbi:PilZ domain-containing protein [Sphingomonas sp. PP-F2F-G114-C0414]|uniref:PilZ domain-containing protein n=1 Tax=Sphingomonas sp. PP-F2F-G114-C0414 TaxID=2135662 RepID=UPI000F29F14A|nr:PilZ domain-containing protein [Sphingomonas sp. PP-F2F-G114-C0414]RMB36048.1 PilZ domain-containing protein [Sphingomonas sp. PP-F2F-G114-C0414]
MTEAFDRSTTTDTAADAQDTSSPNASGNRVGSRDSLFLMAKLRLADERRPREVRVRNLSERGVMLELDKVVAIATPVLLELRGLGEIGGKVAWCTQGRIGVALDSPIDPKKARKVAGVSQSANTPFYAKATTER